MHKTEVGVPENVRNDVEKRERGSYVHARKNKIGIVKKVMRKLFVGILISSVLIGMLTVIPENVRAQDPSDIMISTGESHELVHGYSICALQIDVESGKVWIALNRDGTEVASEVVPMDTDFSLYDGELFYFKATIGDVFRVDSVGDAFRRIDAYGDVYGVRLTDPNWGVVFYPSQTQNLQATPGDHYVNLDWNTPSVDGSAAITNYKIYRGTTYGGETLLTTVGNVLTYTDKDVTNDQTYYYQVSAVNSAGEGAMSEGVKATPISDVTTPSAPRNLQATPGEGYVNLDWDKPSVDGSAAITNYMIYRGTTSGEEILLTTVGNVLTYTDKDVTNDQTYYYQVSAVNSAGEGEKSEEVPATPTSGVTVPSDPPELKATGGNHEVKLEWKKPEDAGGAPITEYRIYRGTTSRDVGLLETVGDVRTHTDENLKNGQTYYYRVSAVNSAGEGKRSHDANAIPKLDWTFIAVLIGAAATIAAATINYLISRKRGSVSATSSPDGARVFLDGVDKGESPVTLDKVQKGTHIVLFSKSGYSDCEKRVVVNADQITPVHCDLKKPEMKLRLSAEPTEIPADGKSKSVITISVEDENGTPAPVPKDTEIVLETNIGLIDTPVKIRAGDVQARSILTSSTAGGTATVRAKSESGLESSVAVRFA